MSLLLLLGGVTGGGGGEEPTYTEKPMTALVKEVEASVGLGLLLESTASGNTFYFGEVSEAAPSGAPSGDKPAMVIQDDGSSRVLWVYCPVSGDWFSSTLS